MTSSLHATRAASVAIALATTLAGCGGTSRQADAPPTAAATAPAEGGVRLLGEPVLGSGTLTDFALRDQDGELARLSNQYGKVVLLTFLYTNCPDVCPLIAEAAGRAVQRLGGSSEDVRVLAVSVDPEGDTPQFVRAFLDDHRTPPQFRYLTGTRTELLPIWQAYNVLAEQRDFERINHSTYVLLIDADGEPLAYYPPQVTATTLEHDLRIALGS